MTLLRALPGGATSPAADGFEIGFVDEDGVERRALLADAWAAPFERYRPVRRFPSYKGQKHFPGQWWSATMGGHVGFESWLERDHLMLLDFDPAVVGVSSQPFWLFWAVESGKVRSHAPDYFARLDDGSALVVDCRPADRIKPKDAAKFDATRHVGPVLARDWSVRMDLFVGTVDVSAQATTSLGPTTPAASKDDISQLSSPTTSDPPQRNPPPSTLSPALHPGPAATHRQNHEEDDRYSDANASSSPHREPDGAKVTVGDERLGIRGGARSGVAHGGLRWHRPHWRVSNASTAR